MKTILSFLKPYRKRLLFISLIMIADVGGSLLVPTITANMINLAVSQADLSDILVQGIWMLGIALLSGGLTLLGSWLCARLSADFGRDLRVALYDKTLSFSTTDFETFGTASMITRTLNDINVLQQSLMNVLQLVLPVPVMCALGIFFSFSIVLLPGNIFTRTKHGEENRTALTTHGISLPYFCAFVNCFACLSRVK